MLGRAGRNEDDVESLESTEESVDIVREGGRDMRRRVSMELLRGGEWLSTMGVEWSWEGESDTSLENWATANGGESEDTGRVERVKLSRKGGGRASLRGRSEGGGSLAMGGGVISGSCSASRSRLKSGDEVEGEDVPEPDSEPDRLCRFLGDKLESQRRTGAGWTEDWSGAAEEVGLSWDVLSRDVRGLWWGDIESFLEPRRVSRRFARLKRDGRSVMDIPVRPFLRCRSQHLLAAVTSHPAFHMPPPVLPSILRPSEGVPDSE